MRGVHLVGVFHLTSKHHKIPPSMELTSKYEKNTTYGTENITKKYDHYKMSHIRKRIRVRQEKKYNYGEDEGFYFHYELRKKKLRCREERQNVENNVKV